MPSHLIEPHGASLVQLLAEEERARELKGLACNALSWTLSPRQLCDLELLLCGALSPLTGFLTEADYTSVCETMRLADGTLWPIPVVLDVPEAIGESLGPGEILFLRDSEGVPLAAVHVDSVWKPDQNRKTERVHEARNRERPVGDPLILHTHPVYVGGRVEGIQSPVHYDFVQYRLSPAELRRRFAALGWRRIIAFQTRKPMHRAEVELTHRATRELQADLLIHAIVEATTTGDVDHCPRIRCYQAILRHYPPGTAMLALLPLAVRTSGIRGALSQAIICKNHGCTHLIIGPCHAGQGPSFSDRSSQGPQGVPKLLQQYADELGVGIVPFQSLVYSDAKDAYVPIEEVPQGTEAKSIDDAELGRFLAEGREIPAWFSFPDVVRELQRAHPPRNRQGFTVFFTGLPSSGKSTLARALNMKLLEIGGRPVTLLDGDIVRIYLSPELGFSREHRDLNVQRVGFVASEITKNGGIELCALIAPYASLRRDVRKLVESKGGFILVHVATPLEVCEQQDRKGLYAKARAGTLPQFTGSPTRTRSPTTRT